MKKISVLYVVTMLAMVGCNSDQQHTDSLSNNNLDGSSSVAPSSKAKRDLALQLSQNYSAIEPTLRKAITAQQTNLSVSKFAQQMPALALSGKLLEADKQLRSRKGIADYAEQLLEVRLANNAMLPAWLDGESPLFAYEPSGPESQWSYIEAFDIYGNIHHLDVAELPDLPVLVIDNNSREELQAGLKAMQAELQQLGQATMLHPYTANNTAQKPMVAEAGTVQPFQTTILKKIHLEDVQEPWISGKAEFYALVTGVSPDYDKPTLDLVEMPYLDYANKDYFPNQIVVKWSNYRWGAADLILMEQDDDTNYKGLAKRLLEAASTALAAHPETLSYAVIPEITNKIIEALPDRAFTNDDDLVDIYYTLLQDSSYVDHFGAKANAVATFEPLTINPTQP